MLTRPRFSRTTYGLLLATLAAVALLAINEFSQRESSRALADMAEAQQMRAQLSQLVQNVLDAETGQRGFLLTGEARYREPYDRALQQINANLTALRQMYLGHPEEREQLAELAVHVGRKIGEIDMTVRMRQAGNEEAWRFVVGTDVGREEMDTIRTRADALIRTSTASLLQGQRQIATALKFARVGIAGVTLAALLAFGLYLRQTQALRRSGQRQQEALQRERNQLEALVRERTATLAELATHLQEVRENERGYLARELHDELGSLLTAAKLDVARLKSRVTEADALQRLQHLTELLNSGIALKRRIIEDLRPSSLANLGLVASLEILGREFADRAGLQIEMLLEPVSLDESRQLTVYRMVQECLTNIGKYAHAKEVTIVLKNYGNHVIVEVGDDGQGFDTARVRPSSHGLAGMRHRVEAAGGKLSIASRPGGGSRLTAMVPAQPAEIAADAEPGDAAPPVAQA